MVGWQCPLKRNEEGAANTGASSVVEEVNSATSTLFKGDIVRTFTGDWKFGGNWQQPSGPTAADSSKHPSCFKWGVVATIYNPSLAIARAADMAGWCLVIVADMLTPKDYIQKAGFFEGKNSTVVFFSVRDQQQWMNTTDEIGEFTHAIPFKHFARKNLGYLYAIRRGAKFILELLR
jgi:hypothetical protein